MIVVDGSALVVAAVDSTGRGRRVRERLADAGQIAAPHLVDAEIGQGMRGLVLRGVLAEHHAARALALATRLVVMRYEHRAFVDRAWNLRNNVSFYDGLYVALAEALDVPLLTADRRLSTAVGPRCSLEVA